MCSLFCTTCLDHRGAWEKKNIAKLQSIPLKTNVLLTYAFPYKKIKACYSVQQVFLYTARSYEGIDPLLLQRS